LGTTAPDGSDTRPLREAVCASNAGADTQIKSKAMRKSQCYA
jgi:hypothetical protein